jgi:7-keto-8-aminopelargonate synthetase-like enzyme
MNQKNINSFEDRLFLDDAIVRKVGFNPYYPVIQSGLSDPLVIGGKNYIDLASNNYLGLAQDIRVKKAVWSAVEKYGVSMCGTPVATGYTDLYRRIGNRLSEFIGLPESVIYPSCYQANNGLFNAIVRTGDIVIIDRGAHSSLMEGVKTAGCKIRPFLHNDPDHLEDQLIKSQGATQVFVVTESVFSTEGSVAPFKEIYELCCRYGAVPVIDDSHGIGVIGKSGRGILEYSGITGYQGFYTASLGKALANIGGLISGPEKYLGYLKYFSSHLVYSTAIQPSVLAGTEKVLDIIEEEFSYLRQKMFRYKTILSNALIQSGWSLTGSITPILSIKSNTSENTIKVAKLLFDNGILSTPFIYPSVQVNQGRVRLICGCNIKEDSAYIAASIFKSIFPELI